MLQYFVTWQLLPNKLHCNEGLIFSFFEAVFFVSIIRVAIRLISSVAKLITKLQLLNLELNIYVGNIDASLYVDDLKLALV